MDQINQARHNFQAISWFWDHYQRDLLDLDPPYQRRSVWPQSYKDAFIDTILLGYPSPAIFLYEEMHPTGRATYHVVDGKQRLTTVFSFASGDFPIGDKSPLASLRSLRFADLTVDRKKAFWSYQFLVEYVPTNAEAVINDIFDRINRNVARLTPQELRHARFSGRFIKAAEDTAEWLFSQSADFPRIVASSRRQMKDVQFVAELLLLIENGPKGYSQEELDLAFSTRDDEWSEEIEVTERFRQTAAYLNRLVNSYDSIRQSRLRNQVDYYSLFGAVDALASQQMLPPIEDVGPRIVEFTHLVDSPEERQARPQIQKYYEAARSAASDTANRTTRIDTLSQIIQG